MIVNIDIPEGLIDRLRALSAGESILDIVKGALALADIAADHICHDGDGPYIKIVSPRGGHVTVELGRPRVEKE